MQPPPPVDLVEMNDTRENSSNQFETVVKINEQWNNPSIFCRVVVPQIYVPFPNVFGCNELQNIDGSTQIQRNGTTKNDTHFWIALQQVH